MALPALSEILKLPANERAELAMALWESLTDAQRDTELTLTAEQEAHGLAFASRAV